MKNIVLFLCTHLLFLSNKSNEIIRFTSPNKTTIATYISSAHFKNQGDTSLVRTYTINTPGTYILTEDIASSVVSTSTAIVYINSDDVILNLGGHTLSQSSSESSIDGIAIEVGKDNITIKNGIIKNCTGNGIGINYDCSNIILKNVWVKNCTTAGINLLGIENGTIDNLLIFNSNMSLNIGDASHDAVGLKMAYCVGCEIKECTINNNSNTNASRSAYGVYANNCQSITFNGVKTNKHIGTVLGCGFYFETCKSLLVQNCYSINNETTTDNTANPCAGFYLNQVSRSMFNSTTTMRNVNGKNAYGFYLYTSVCNYFYKCQAIGSHATNCTVNTDKALGFAFREYSNANVLDECRGNSNVASGTNGQGWGFEAYVSHANFISESMFSSNRGQDQGGGGAWRGDAHRNNALFTNAGANTGDVGGKRINTYSGSFSSSTSSSGSSNAQLTDTHYP